MITLRGSTYYLDCTVGPRRCRVTLGTKDPRAAERLSNRVQFALADGPHSEVWESLRSALPASSFKTLTANLNLPSASDVTEFETQFLARLDRRVKLGEIAQSSCNLYSKAAECFFSWCAENGVKSIAGITPSAVEGYLVWRKTAILSKGGSGRGLVSDYTTLQAVFDYAVGEGIIRKSPLKIRYKADDSKAEEPFTAQELDKLAAATDELTYLPYLLLRHTGLRGSDAISVAWSSINWTTGTLTWITKKRRTTVVIPLVTELRDALADKFSRRGKLEDSILSLGRKRLYDLMSGLGKKAGVNNAHPHRYRHTLGATILDNGGSIFDVARILGDTVATVDKYYATHTQTQQDRVRNLLESSQTEQTEGKRRHPDQHSGE